MSVSGIIEFDNNSYGTYFAGQMLSGKVTIHTTKEKQIKGILLKIKGFAHTSWSESSGSGSQKRSHHYSGHEDYIASSTYLIGSDKNQPVVLEAGTHCYVFHCHIPETCPTSFEGRDGHIRYTVQVTLVRPWKFDQTFMKGFTVVKYMDLNYESPTLREPIQTIVAKTFGFGPFKSGPLQLQISLPQSGYVPGQEIPITLLLINDSKIAIVEIKIQLMLLVRYFSQNQSKSKNQRIVVTKMKGDPVQQYCRKLLNYRLQVPATPPTCLNFCGIIQIAYQIEMEAKVKGLHANQVICAPVIIGNIPLQSVMVADEHPTTSRSSEMKPGSEVGATEKIEEANKVTENALDTTNADPIMPPPTYQEAVYMPHARINESEPHDYGETDFAPRYPVFQMKSFSEKTSEDCTEKLRTKEDN